MTTKTLIEAAHVRVGQTILRPASGNSPVVVESIQRNPHYGWIGFNGHEFFGFCGWYNPTDQVCVVEEVRHD